MRGAPAALLILASYGLITFAKFGEFNAMPVRYNYSSERLASIGGSMFQAANWRWNLSTYLGFEGVTYKSSFPYLFPSFQTSSKEDALLRFPEARIDKIEPSHMGIPTAMSGLLILATIGVLSCWFWHGMEGKQLFILCLCASVGPCAMLFFTYLSFRYFHEYLLLFALAGSVGVNVISAASLEALWANSINGSVIFFTAMNLWLNLSFAIRYQMYDTSVGRPVGAMQTQIEELRKLVRSVYSGLR